jgi:tRNA(fMet)-specific endonuclease VapC
LSQNVTVLEFSEPDSRAAGAIRADLERQGTRIGEYDTLIAGQAFARNLILVTANTSEFARVEGLVVEDWTL